MMLIVWAVIAIAVLVSALLIYMEHEWGFALGGTTAVILVISYFLAEPIMRSPLVVLLPEESNSHLDTMALMAGALLVLALVAVAYLAGRSRSASGKKARAIADECAVLTRVLLASFAVQQAASGCKAPKAAAVLRRGLNPASARRAARGGGGGARRAATAPGAAGRRA